MRRSDLVVKVEASPRRVVGLAKVRSKTVPYCDHQLKDPWSSDGARELPSPDRGGSTLSVAVTLDGKEE